MSLYIKTILLSTNKVEYCDIRWVQIDNIIGIMRLEIYRIYQFERDENFSVALKICGWKEIWLWIVFENDHLFNQIVFSSNLYISLFYLYFVYNKPMKIFWFLDVNAHF